MRLFYLLIGFLFISNTLFSQTSIYGKVTDTKTGEELLYADIVLMMNDTFVKKIPTDFEGNFSTPLNQGIYNLKISYRGYVEKLITGIVVKTGQGSKVDIQMEEDTNLSTQTSIYGKVTDVETGEGLIWANIVLTKNGVFFTGTATDFEGNYNIPVDPGTYAVKITYTGYPEKSITGVIVKANQSSKLDIQIEEGFIIYCGHSEYKIPLIEIENTTSKTEMTSEQIRNQPSKNITELIQSTPGVSIINF